MTETLKAMLKKARNDSEFEAKLNALGESGAKPEAIIAFAAEHGFAVTAEDFKSCGSGRAELIEAELDNVAGGFLPTQNRYDPNVCPTLTRPRYECAGFLNFISCDHYSAQSRGKGAWHFKCAMGAFDYIGMSGGKPY